MTEKVRITTNLGAYMSGGKISVIVPCFNIEKYIDRTVQSILEQSYKNLEIILVDDGSTDNTSSIIDKLGKTYENVHSFHKKNGGVSSARLYGINHSSGDWIAFVDGDDLLKTKMYATLIDNAMRFDADISHCGYEMIFSDHTDQYYGSEKIIVQSNYEGLRDLLSGNFIEPGLWNKLYKRELVEKTMADCSANQNIRNMEDLLWNYYFFKKSTKSVFYDHCFYQYILRKGSAATSYPNKHKVLDPIRVFRIIRNDISCSDELKSIVLGRELAKLIDIAVMEKDGQPDWCFYSSQRARKILHSCKKTLLCGKFSIRFKVRLFLFLISPQMYVYIHKLYAKFRGTANKYDI